MKHSYIIYLVVQLRKLYINMELNPEKRKISNYDHPSPEEILFQQNMICAF